MRQAAPAEPLQIGGTNMSCSSLQGSQFGLTSVPRGATAHSRRVIDALREVGVWFARSRERHALAGLDHRLLADIGIPQEAAEREAAKPFWRR
jgi:uncharacterized protein YjiS (DUF1127 family)